MVTGKTLLLVEQKRVEASAKSKSPEHQNSFIRKISFEVHQIPNISFSINEVQFSNESHFASSATTIRLLFEITGEQNTPVAKQVTFENRGIRTLRFYWHKLEKFRTFRDISIDRPQTTAFYFDKTEVLLVPGRELQLPIWFEPSEAGHYTECWEIKTAPKIWDEEFKFVVRLQGIVTDVNFEAKCGTIKKMLSNKVRNTLIKDILNESMISLRYTESEQIVYSFCDKEMFEGANQEVIGVAKKPKYLYDKDLVNELKDMYKSVRKANYSDEDWDYSIEALKVLAREKDVVEYVEKLTADCEWSKNRLKELSGAVEQTEIELVLENEPKTTGSNYENLQILLHKLERPAMIPNKEREKFLHVYFIVGSYFSKMCAALDSLNGGTGDVLKNYLPFYDFGKVSSTEDLPSRLVIEKFDDIWVERTKRAPPELQTGFIMSSKPKILENIPLEDTATVFQVYFKKSQKSGKQDAKSPQKPAPNLEKRTKSKQLSTQKISQTTTEGLVRENFDPFADIESLNQNLPNFQESIVSSLYTAPEITNIIHKKNGYDYQKYLIIYTSLCSAVDAMVAVLETLKERVVSIATFGEVSKMPYTKETESQNINRCSEDDTYFRYLLETHLTNNQATNEYFIAGRTAPSVEEVSEQEEPSINEELPNLFKSHETLIVEPIESRSTLISQGVQTSFTTDMDSDVTSESVIKVESLEDIDNIEESEKPSDIFYFMDNERAEE